MRYAQPPLGELRLILFIGSYVSQRFRNPQPFQSGEILYDVAGESTVQCPQLGGVKMEKSTKIILFDQIDASSDEVIGEEDCLVMNIYSPNLTPDLPYPVMVCNLSSKAKDLNFHFALN